jgi:hypothetical protein
VAIAPPLPVRAQVGKLPFAVRVRRVTILVATILVATFLFTGVPGRVHPSVALVKAVELRDVSPIGL